MFADLAYRATTTPLNGGATGTAVFHFEPRHREGLRQRLAVERRVAVVPQPAF